MRTIRYPRWLETRLKTIYAWLKAATFTLKERHFTTYARYIMWRIAGPMILIMFSLTLIALLIQSLRFVKLIIENGIGFTTFLYISSLLTPLLLWFILPIALCISILFIYNKLASDSETIALLNTGLSRYDIKKPALVITLIATLFSYLISLYLLPSSYRQFKDLQLVIRDQFASIMVQEGVFISPTNGIMVYITERDDTGILKGVMYQNDRDPYITETVIAESARLVSSPTGPKILLSNGIKKEIERATNRVKLWVEFESYPLEIAYVKKDKNNQRLREAEERFLPDLFWPKDTRTKEQAQRLQAEGHHRLTWPLYNIMVALICLNALVRNRHGRRSNAWPIMRATTLTILVIICGFSLFNLTAKHIEYAFAMYGLSIGGSVFIWYRTFPKKNRPAELI